MYKEGYSEFQENNERTSIFEDKGRSRERVIVGIESSFDESACSVMNSFGEVLCQGGRDVSFTEPALKEGYAGGVDP